MWEEHKLKLKFMVTVTRDSAGSNPAPPKPNGAG